VSRPIVCGGVLVRPGDVIAADSDGVLVIPRVHAREVAADARKLLDGDTAARRLYDPLRIPPDRTLKTPRHP
jgi:regulator of RNase E activity RraA